MSPRSALPMRHEFVVLGLIHRHPAHGYELMQQWNEDNGIALVWRLKPGLLYAALEKLERMDFIRSRLISGSDAPDRKEYSITPAGEAAFLGWVKTPVSSARDFRQDFLVKWYFLQDVNSPLASELITRQVVICRKWLESLCTQRDSSYGYQSSIFQYRIYQVQGILKWLLELSGESH